ncbi:hypothetical protein PV325_005060 [Microctonus aethiopoides]|nr:hypothetical protein PV325_005060 [Microctonus aethiopoides]
MSAAIAVGPLVTENRNVNQIKSLNANRYATKKTIAQGMLDIALLTANASQLKYILQVGRAHEFYTLMLVLISLSIGLQILSGLLSLSLNLMMDRKMEETRNEYAMEWIGRVRLSLSFIVFLDNILIAAFDPMGLALLLQYDAALAVVGILFIIIGGLDISKPRDHWAANILNDIILIAVFVITLVNVAVSGFGMEFSNKPPELLTFKRRMNELDSLLE